MNTPWTKSVKQINQTLGYSKSWSSSSAHMKLCTFTTSSSIHALEEQVDEHARALQVAATATGYRTWLTDVMIVAHG